MDTSTGDGLRFSYGKVIVIWKYILLSSFYENIYKKWDVTKKYKNVLNSVITDFFVHYQMFLTVISYTNTTSRQKKVIQVVQLSGVTQLQIT